MRSHSQTSDHHRGARSALAGFATAPSLSAIAAATVSLNPVSHSASVSGAENVPSVFFGKLLLLEVKGHHFSSPKAPSS
jgi:hypothetical protein